MSDFEAPLNATVVERDDVNPALSIVRVKPDEGPVPSFVPGQFTMLGLPNPDRPGRLKKRAFSIASAPSDTEAMEFYVQLVKDGDFTTKLWDVPRGGRIWMDEKTSGRFVLDPVPDGRDLLFIASGTGLAPFVSMTRAHPDGSRFGRWTVLHTVRRIADLGYRAELSAWAASDARFTYLPTVTREPDDADWSGARGRVQTLLGDGAYERATGAPLDPERTHVFLCGNPEMIMAVHEWLEPHGFTLHGKDQPGNIHYERYW